MPQQLLHSGHGHPVLKQQRGEGVARRVKCHAECGQYASHLQQVFQRTVYQRVVAQSAGHLVWVAAVGCQHLGGASVEQLAVGYGHALASLLHLHPYPSVVADVLDAQTAQVAEAQSRVTTKQEAVAYLSLLPVQVVEASEPSHVVVGEESAAARHALHVVAVEGVAGYEVALHSLVQHGSQQPEPAYAGVVGHTAVFQQLVVLHDELIVHLVNPDTLPPLCNVVKHGAVALLRYLAAVALVDDRASEVHQLCRRRGIGLHGFLEHGQRHADVTFQEVQLHSLNVYPRATQDNVQVIGQLMIYNHAVLPMSRLQIDARGEIYPSLALLTLHLHQPLTASVQPTGVIPHQPVAYLVGACRFSLRHVFLVLRKLMQNLCNVLLFSINAKRQRSVVCPMMNT